MFVSHLVSHLGTDAAKDLDFLCRNKILRHVGISLVNVTRSMFLISVVPVTFGLTCFPTAR